MDAESPSLRNSLKFRIIGAVLALVLVLGGVWLVARQRSGGNTANQSANRNVASIAPINAFDARQGTVTPDADADGLSDQQETELGTNPTVSDTDRDGLSDFDEQSIYHSDPKKPDSDSDGNPDGIEVKKGYSPTGAGRLFDTSPTATP